MNSSVTQSNIASTICRRGYSASVRPPESVTRQSDHRVPLALGGATLDLRNLRIQPWPEARCKDALEVELSKAVCIGSVTLAEAQREIATEWRAAYKDWLDPKGCE